VFCRCLGATERRICWLWTAIYVRRSTVAVELGVTPFLRVLQMDKALSLELKSTLRCAILFEPQSRVRVMPITPRDVMWTPMPHIFGDATLRTRGPTATSANVSNTSTMPEKFSKPQKLARFYKCGYSDQPRCSSGNIVC
jgi:hypothetical protein